MTEFCKQADAAGNWSYLESSPLGKSLYERFEFEARDTFSVLVDGQQYTNTCMIREPHLVGNIGG
jgi:hypothetical protein